MNQNNYSSVTWAINSVAQLYDLIAVINLTLIYHLQIKLSAFDFSCLKLLKFLVLDDFSKVIKIKLLTVVFTVRCINHRTCINYWRHTFTYQSKNSKNLIRAIFIEENGA